MKPLKKITIRKKEDEIFLLNSATNEVIGEIFGEGHGISPARAKENAERIALAFNRHNLAIKALSAHLKLTPEHPDYMREAVRVLAREATKGLPKVKEPKQPKDTARYFLITIEERNGEQQYTVNRPVELKKGERINARAEYEARTWYGDDDAEKHDGWYEFFGGSLIARSRGWKQIDKHTYDILNQYR